MLVIVPNVLRDRINKALDAAYQDCPQAEVDREAHYSALLNYFDEHGNLPEITFERIGSR